MNTKANHQYDAIPDELKKLPNWVLSKNKIPLAVSGFPAKSNDPSTWTSYKDVFEKFKNYPSRFDGIGFQLGTNFCPTPYTILDFDHCLDPKTQKFFPLSCGNCVVDELLTVLNSYTEISTSGTGLHVILKNKFPLEDGKSGFKSKTKDDFHTEIYNANHFFVLTGNIFENRRNIVEVETNTLNFILEVAFVSKNDVYCEKQSNSVTDTVKHEYLPSSISKWVGNDENLSPEVWEQPIPFDETTLPEFSVETLPETVSKFVKALSVSTQTPLEMAGILVLGVLSTCMQGKYTIRINSSYSEPLNLYVVAVASPSERKSAVISALLSPLIKYEKDYNILHSSDLAENLSERRSLENKLKKAEMSDKISKEKTLQIANELNNFKAIQELKLIVDDITPEKLVNVLSEQKGRVTIASSEGGVFESFNGKYDKNLNIEPYLKAYSADTIRVDRIGRSSDYINSPTLSMILTVQPIVLTKFANNEHFKGKGLVARFLYAMCKSNQGNRNVEPESIPDDVQNEFYEFVYKKQKNGETGIFELSEEARICYVEYAKILEKRLKEEWYHMKDYGGKALGSMLRIAGLFHGSSYENPAKVLVEKNTIIRAINLIECLNKHAAIVYGTNESLENIADAKYVLKHIIKLKKSHQKIVFSKREIHRSCENRFRIVSKLEAPLKLLEKMEYIRIETSLKNTRRGGRPNASITLNPLYFNNNK